MIEKLLEKLKMAGLVMALALTLGIAAPATIVAQDQAATEVADTAAEVTDDDDDGFDWGLLGLIGLLGLGGLFRRNEPAVRTVERPIDRTDTTIR